MPLWGPLRCPLAKVEEPCGMFQRSLIGFRCFGPLASPPTNAPSCVSCAIGLNSPNTLLSPLNERGQTYKMDTSLLWNFNKFRQRRSRKIKFGLHLHYPATQQSFSSFLLSSWTENIPPSPSFTINVLRKTGRWSWAIPSHINGNCTGSPWMKALLVIKV